MSKSVESTRQDLFENWFNDFQHARLNRGYDEYTSWEVTLMNKAFNAALDAVEIDLEPAIRTVGGGPIDGSMYTSEVYKAIESLNLGIKIRT